MPISMLTDRVFIVYPWTTVTLSAIQPVNLYPQQASYTTSQGLPWSLTIRAFGGSGCNFKYSSNSDAPFVQNIGRKNMLTELEGDAIGRFEFDVTVADPCGGGSISRVYDVMINPRPHDELSSYDVNTQCEGIY